MATGIAKEIGARIKKARGDVSQRDFARKIGISSNTLGRYERGEIAPGSEAIALLCTKANIDPRWLLFGDQGDRTAPGEPEGAADPTDLQSEVSRLSKENRELMVDIVTLVKEKNDLLGQLYEKAIDPERDFVMQVVGLAECSISGWYTFSNTTLHTVAPVDIAKSKEAFAAIAIGDSMIPAGIEPGFLVFCDPSLEPKKGDAVFVERTDGHATIKIYGGEVNFKGQAMIRLQGWLPRKEDDPSAPQEPFTMDELLDTIKRVAPVVYVKRRP